MAIEINESFFSYIQLLPVFADIVVKHIDLIDMPMLGRRAVITCLYAAIKLDQK